MKISVITINYNNLEGLRRTIGSVINQSCKPFEFIVIDGGSTDGSKELIEQHDEHITYWCSEKDAGLYNAMNKGIDKASGDYCIFMNSGDMFHDHEVLKDVTSGAMDADIISGDILFDNGLHCLSEERVSLAHLHEHSLYHQATFIRTELLKKNRYDESLKIAADWKFFFEEIVLRGHSYKHIRRDIAIFEEGGISSNSHDLIRREMSGVLLKHFPQSVLDDYQRFTHGEDDYDRFFMMLKHSRVKDLIFKIDKILYGILTFCKKR